MAVRTFHGQTLPDARRRPRRPHAYRHRHSPTRRPRGDRPHMGRTRGVADGASATLQPRRGCARRARAALRMLLQQKGYPAGTAGAARSAGRLSRNLPRPDRCRARAATPCRRAAAGVASAHRCHHVHGARSPARRLHRRSSTTSWSAAATGWPPTTSRSSWTTRPRAWTRWYAATTCWRPPRARPTSRTCWAIRSRRTRTSRWCSTSDGARLAKRDGAVTLAEIGMPRALEQIAASLGFRATTLDGMLGEFDPAALPREPWVYVAGA